MTETTKSEEPGQPDLIMVPAGAHQAEMPFAVVEGKPMTQLPLDLYIPPDALEVILEAFEGPLDLLLYLIKRQNLDILDIKVAEITRQYMDYIGLMTELQFELAAEYLVMAAVLAEIKSRMLLPRQIDDDDDEDDPRAELIRRLQEYERFKQAALDIDEIPRANRDFWIVKAEAPVVEREKPLPDIKLQEMLIALSKVLKRVENFTSHRVELEPLSTRERMSAVLDRIHQAGDQFLDFVSLFSPEEGRAGVVVTFLAILELIKESLLEIVQAEDFGTIHVRAKVPSDHVIEIDELEYDGFDSDSIEMERVERPSAEPEDLYLEPGDSASDHAAPETPDLDGLKPENQEPENQEPENQEPESQQSESPTTDSQ